MNSSQVKLVSLGQFHWFHIWCCSDRRRPIILAWGAFLWGLHLISSVWTNTSSFWTYPGQDEMPGCCGKHTDWNRPPWSGAIVTICMSCFMTGGPGKEHWTKKSPATGRVQESQPHVRPPPRILLAASTLAEQGVHQQEGLLSQNDWQPRNESHYHRTKTASHVAEQFSWVPLSSCSPPGCPFPIKPLAFSARVSSDNSFLSVRQEPSFRPWKGSPLLPQGYSPSFRHHGHIIYPT